jgi:hypothetical protein
MSAILEPAKSGNGSVVPPAESILRIDDMLIAIAAF